MGTIGKSKRNLNFGQKHDSDTPGVGFYDIEQFQSLAKASENQFSIKYMPKKLSKISKTGRSSPILGNYDQIEAKATPTP